MWHLVSWAELASRPAVGTLFSWELKLVSVTHMQPYPRPVKKALIMQGPRWVSLTDVQVRREGSSQMTKTGPPASGSPRTSCL